jgi:hypothetical protein
MLRQSEGTLGSNNVLEFDSAKNRADKLAEILRVPSNHSNYVILDHLGEDRLGEHLRGNPVVRASGSQHQVSKARLSSAGLRRSPQGLLAIRFLFIRDLVFGELRARAELRKAERRISLLVLLRHHSSHRHQRQSTTGISQGEIFLTEPTNHLRAELRFLRKQ